MHKVNLYINADRMYDKRIIIVILILKFYSENQKNKDCFCYMEGGSYTIV